MLKLIFVLTFHTALNQQCSLSILVINNSSFLLSLHMFLFQKYGKKVTQQLLIHVKGILDTCILVQNHDLWSKKKQYCTRQLTLCKIGFLCSIYKPSYRTNRNTFIVQCKLILLHSKEFGSIANIPIVPPSATTNQICDGARII